MARAQRKSGTETRRTKKREPKPNGASKPVGTVVDLSDEDAATIRRVAAPIKALYEQLGRERERHHNAEAQLLKALQDAGNEHRTVAVAVAGKYGIETADATQQWALNDDGSRFTRTR